MSSIRGQELPQGSHLYRVRPSSGLDAVEVGPLLDKLRGSDEVEANRRKIEELTSCRRRRLDFVYESIWAEGVGHGH